MEVLAKMPMYGSLNRFIIECECQNDRERKLLTSPNDEPLMLYHNSATKPKPLTITINDNDNTLTVSWDDCDRTTVDIGEDSYKAFCEALAIKTYSSKCNIEQIIHEGIMSIWECCQNGKITISPYSLVDLFDMGCSISSSNFRIIEPKNNQEKTFSARLFVIAFSQREALKIAIDGFLERGFCLYAYSSTDDVARKDMRNRDEIEKDFGFVTQLYVGDKKNCMVTILAKGEESAKIIGRLLIKEYQQR